MKLTIHEIFEQWQKALQAEISTLKDKGGSSVHIRHGKMISSHKDEYIYVFYTSSDVYLVEGAAVRIKYNEEDYLGEIISVEGNQLIVTLATYIGKTVSDLELSTEPWRLIEALLTRLDEASNDQQKLRQVSKLLRGNAADNHHQQHAETPLKEVVNRSLYNDTTYVWGPPGTGKTFTLSRVIVQNYVKGQKILVLTHSNAALDVVMLAVTNFLSERGRWKTGDIIRYGMSRDEQVIAHDSLLSSTIAEQIHHQIRDRKMVITEQKDYVKEKIEAKQHVPIQSVTSLQTELEGYRSELTEAEKEVIQRARVIGVTLTKAAVDKQIFDRNYDLIVIDEASMAYVPQIAFAATLGKRIVVCGDFQQLPPIALSDNMYVNRWLKEDIFRKTNIVTTLEQQGRHPNLFMLTKQRRMHPDISAFSNVEMYQSNVSDHLTVKKRAIIARKKPYPGDAMIFIDSSYFQAFAMKDEIYESRFNLITACLALHHIFVAYRNGHKSIGYVTPYRAQARIISTWLNERMPLSKLAEGTTITAATIHKFQGSERDFMIFDIVDSNGQLTAGQLLTNKQSSRLVNVAVTRAKGKLLTIADQPFIKSKVGKDKAISKLLNHMHKKNHKQSHDNIVASLTDERGSKQLTWYRNNEVNDILLKDISNANKRIMISVPQLHNYHNQLWPVLKDLSNKLVITIITEEPEQIPLQSYHLVQKRVLQPFVIIDERIIWAIAQTDIQVAAKMNAPQTVRLLLKYLNIPLAKRNQMQVRETILLHHPTISLKKYIATWHYCYVCNHQQSSFIDEEGKILLECKHCYSKRVLSDKILAKYLQYIDAKCKQCHSKLNEEMKIGQAAIYCSTCKVYYDAKRLW
ncbi:AAA domain-containing protein [Bacillus sp. SM2101]|uniref:AAA domain-containing protein n=1 Tax=Bacillus sp. SM2101 TaxID=2805366 RepID=UPI001BDE6C5D|nr:AAA domain-containing protein [Bacillus sp. SM2101]